MSIAVNNDKILINLEKNMEQLTMREQWCTIFSINQYLLNRFLEQIITVPWQSVILLANISWLFKCDTNETKSTEARGSYLWSTDRNWTLTLICQVSQTRIDPPACLCLAWANEIFLKNLRQLIIISLQIVLYYRFRFYDLFYFNRRLWDWTQKLSSPSFIVMVLMGLLQHLCIMYFALYFLMNENRVVCNLILNAIYMQIVANYCESLTLDSCIKSWMSEAVAVLQAGHPALQQPRIQ